jgi:hypothetical protein
MPDEVVPTPSPSGLQRHRSRRRRERPAAEGSTARPERPAAAPEVGEPKETDRTLRGLVGSGPSQLGLEAAMRARDASRPTPEDLAEAEAEVVIVRRQYVPTESLPPGVRPAARGAGPPAE